MDEVLKYAIENGIIDLSRIQDEIEMTKREELLKNIRIASGKAKMESGILISRTKKKEFQGSERQKRN